MKRKQNSLMLKVKVLQATNTNPARISLTQSNNARRKTIFFRNFDSAYEQIMAELEKMDDIASYSLIVDNTQGEAFIINVDIAAKEFPNIIERF